MTHAQLTALCAAILMTQQGYTLSDAIVDAEALVSTARARAEAQADARAWKRHEDRRQARTEEAD